MAIEFPANPQTDDTYTSGGVVWTFNGSAWKASGGGVTASGVSITDAGGYFTGTDVEAALAEVGSDIAALPAQYAPLRPNVYGDPSGEANGTPTTLSDGTAVTVFGGAPIVVSGGTYTHTPISGVSAGYLQANIGAQVDRIGATIVWEVGEGGSLAFVVAETEWTVPSGLTAAGIHFVCAPTGVWNIARWDGAGSLEIYVTGSLGSLTDGVARTFEIVRDSVDPSTVYVQLPDGTVISVTNAYIASETGPFAVWELFESDGTGVTAGKITQVWAEPANPAAQQASTVQEATKIAAVTQSLLPTNRVWAPSSVATIAATTSMADVDADDAFVTFVAPPSGRVLLVAVVWAALSGTTSYLMRFDLTSTQTASERVAFGAPTGRVRYQYQVSGLVAGTEYTAKLQHMYSGTGATLSAGSASGYSLQCTAHPLAFGSSIDIA